jgi:hypothetical protein
MSTAFERIEPAGAMFSASKGAFTYTLSRLMP